MTPLFQQQSEDMMIHVALRRSYNEATKYLMERARYEKAYDDGTFPRVLGEMVKAARFQNHQARYHLAELRRIAIEQQGRASADA